MHRGSWCEHQSQTVLITCMHTEWSAQSYGSIRRVILLSSAHCRAASALHRAPHAAETTYCTLWNDAQHSVDKSTRAILPSSTLCIETTFRILRSPCSALYEDHVLYFVKITLCTLWRPTSTLRGNQAPQLCGHHAPLLAEITFHTSQRPCYALHRDHLPHFAETTFHTWWRPPSTPDGDMLHTMWSLPSALCRDHPLHFAETTLCTLQKPTSALCRNHPLHFAEIKLRTWWRPWFTINFAVSRDHPVHFTE